MKKRPPSKPIAPLAAQVSPSARLEIAAPQAPARSRAALEAVLAVVRESLSPAALQLVLAVVLFAAIEGYAHAQERRSEEGGGNGNGDGNGEADGRLANQSEREALLALAEAQRDGVISTLEREQLQALLARDFADPQWPDELRWLVAEIANAPVTDGPSLLDQVRAKAANWFL